MTRRASAVVLAVALVAGCGRAPAADAGGEPVPAVALERFTFGGDFTLVDQNGRPSSLKDQRGHLVLAFFGYTECPDVCPLTMSRIVRALELSGAPRDAVRTLFISVDVERDTPDVLAAYVRSFGVPVVGLTGTREAVDTVVAQYRAAYEITPADSASGRTVSHTAYTYLIDRNGDLRYVFRHADTPETMASGLKLLLQANGS